MVYKTPVRSLLLIPQIYANVHTDTSTAVIPYIAGQNAKRLTPKAERKMRNTKDLALSVKLLEQ